LPLLSHVASKLAPVLPQVAPVVAQLGAIPLDLIGPTGLTVLSELRSIARELAPVLADVTGVVSELAAVLTDGSRPPRPHPPPWSSGASSSSPRLRVFIAVDR